MIVALTALSPYAAAQDKSKWQEAMKGWKYSSPLVELPQSGESAGQNNPPCGPAVNHASADEVAKEASAGALGKWLTSVGVPFGNGLSTAVISAVGTPGNMKWLRDRIGGNRGPSTCGTQCLLVPKAEADRLSIWACLSETGGDGLDCGANGWDKGRWMGAEHLTRRDTEKGTIYCITGKNWSDHQNRWFWVVATDGVNPLRPNEKLSQVYNK
jgi:hypothetical protein